MAVIALADPSIDGGGVGETRTLLVRWGVPARRTGACACVRALDPTYASDPDRSWLLPGPSCPEAGARTSLSGGASQQGRRMAVFAFVIGGEASNSTAHCACGEISLKV